MKCLRSRTWADGIGVTVVGLIVLCAGCQGSEGMMGMDDSGMDEPVCGAPPGAAAPGGAVSFSQDIQPIFNTNCTVCHMTDGIDVFAEALLKLTADVSYDLIVDVASAQKPSVNRVDSGDASASLLFQKVSMDNPTVGDRMPLCTESAPRAPLTSAQIGLIRDWINQGAAEN